MPKIDVGNEIVIQYPHGHHRVIHSPLQGTVYTCKHVHVYTNLRPGGYSHIKAYGDVLPQMDYFFTKNP